MSEDATIDPRVYSSFEHLRALEGAARSLSFLPRQPARSVLNGRHGSRLRGRGLNFEELREYRPGDDVRSIDWKTTARRRAPFVRVYTEERDRPALLLVDQRMSMFFGTRHAMKSVVAAEAAAIAAYTLLAQGDRVGGVVFGDEEVVEVRPKRSRRAVHALLQRVSSMNLALHATAPPVDAPTPLDLPLEAALRIARHDHLILVFSDFDQVGERTRRLVSGLSRHNDVLLFVVTDPSAMQVPRGAPLVASDGLLQAEFDTSGERGRAIVQKVSSDRLQGILDWQQELGVPIFPLSAGEETLPQLRRLLGVGARAAR
jgi:uncharacterized protein (DUF58 family)